MAHSGKRMAKDTFSQRSALCPLRYVGLEEDGSSGYH
jgi:hypothetical protein